MTIKLKEFMDDKKVEVHLGPKHFQKMQALMEYTGLNKSETVRWLIDNNELFVNNESFVNKETEFEEILVTIDTMYTVTNVAKILGVSIDVVHKMIKKGELRAFKFHDESIWKVAEQSLVNFLKNKEVKIKFEKE